MTKGPEWLPWNIGDYLKDTTHLSGAEHGAYCLLIMHYWKDGGLPDSEDLIRRKGLMSAEQWLESRSVLVALFDEGWKHKRIEAELAKAADIIGKRRASAEQMHGRRTANAEHEQSMSSYAGVPPSPSPLPESNPPSVPEAASARDLFVELWEAFPQHPGSSETKARASFKRLKAGEQEVTIPAAVRYAKWFAQDCETRDRTVDAGLHFVPHLSTWLDKGEWRDAGKLIIKGEADPDLAVVRRGTPEFAAVEKLRGKPIPKYGDSESVTITKSELEQARAT